MIDPRLERRSAPGSNSSSPRAPGKNGEGVVPSTASARCALCTAADRVFVSLRRSAGDPPLRIERRSMLSRLPSPPVVDLEIAKPEPWAPSSKRWEVATAVAGAMLGINPFDEPNVSESKANTAAALAAFEEGGALKPGHALARADGFSAYGGGLHGSALKPAAADGEAHGDGFERVLAAHLATVSKGDYVAVLAYLDPSTDEAKALARLRLLLRERTGAATTLGIKGYLEICIRKSL